MTSSDNDPAPIEPVTPVQRITGEYERENQSEKRAAWYSLSGFFTASWLKMRAKVESVFSNKPYHEVLAGIINDKITGKIGFFDHVVSGKSLRWFHKDTLKGLDVQNTAVQRAVKEAIFHSPHTETAAALAKMLGA